MRYRSDNNPLYSWYRSTKARVKLKKQTIYPEWITWRGFAKWCEERGYDEFTELHYTTHNPFSPEYVSSEMRYEYIAYDSQDPYELIITSASRIDELAENLKRLGYDYTYESIKSALSRNKTERPIDDRLYGLIFEKIDLSNYNEDDEPFEERI